MPDLQNCAIKIFEKCIFLENYLFFQRFWYQNGENQVKIQLTAFLKNIWNMNIIFF